MIVKSALFPFHESNMTKVLFVNQSLIPVKFQMTIMVTACFIINMCLSGKTKTPHIRACPSSGSALVRGVF